MCKSLDTKFPSNILTLGYWNWDTHFLSVTPFSSWALSCCQNTYGCSRLLNCSITFCSNVRKISKIGKTDESCKEFPIWGSRVAKNSDLTENRVANKRMCTVEMVQDEIERNTRHNKFDLILTIYSYKPIPTYFRVDEFSLRTFHKFLKVLILMQIRPNRLNFVRA